MIATASPTELVEIARQVLERARELGCTAALADAIDSDLKASRTPTEQLGLVATEPAPTAAPSREVAP